METFRHSNLWYWRLARTVVEVVLGFIAANLTQILTGYGLSPEVVTMLVGVYTCVFSPVIADLKQTDGANA
jgi:hypothetical protein